MKQEYVYVLDKDGNPLMPTRKFGKVRHLLKEGLAKVARRDVFTIQLLYEPKTHVVQDVTLGCDTGYAHIGLSASTEQRELYSEETVINNSMIKLLKTRKDNRKKRRSRKCRCRKARYLNRKREEGWLAPSVAHRRDTHINRIKFVHSILPIKTTKVEVASFDIQKLKNPDIEGVEYQHGDCYGYENKKQFVLTRDEHTCQYCKGKSGSNLLEVHHIKWKSNGGTDILTNLITLCSECHKKLHAGKITLNVKETDASFKEAAGVSIMKNSLIKMLKEEYPDKTVDITYGYITKVNRHKYKIPKTHYLDAFVIAGNFNAERLNYHYMFVQRRRHNRSLHVVKYYKGGKRRSTVAKKKINNTHFRMGDYVQYRNKKGFITGSTHGAATVKDIYGKSCLGQDSITVRKLKLIRHQQGQYLVDRLKNLN